MVSFYLHGSQRVCYIYIFCLFIKSVFDEADFLHLFHSMVDYSVLFLKVVQMLLKLLEDKNGEVQNLAVKWYVKISYLLNVYKL